MMRIIDNGSLRQLCRRRPGTSLCLRVIAPPSAGFAPLCRAAVYIYAKTLRQQGIGSSVVGYTVALWRIPISIIANSIPLDVWGLLLISEDLDEYCKFELLTLLFFCTVFINVLRHNLQRDQRYSGKMNEKCVIMIIQWVSPSGGVCKIDSRYGYL